jgi:hypothetical protein
MSGYLLFTGSVFCLAKSFYESGLFLAIVAEALLLSY